MLRRLTMIAAFFAWLAAPSPAAAEANVVLLQKQAEAEPLRQQVAAFGDGNAYAQFFFFQKLAPSVKSILTNTDGPFADLFHQLAAPLKPAPVNSQGQKQLTEASHESH